MMAGCATVYPSSVEIAYHPVDFYDPAANSQGVALRVEVRDIRENKLTVGETLDSNGNESAPIRMRNRDIAYLIAKSTENALASRGFNVSPTAPVLVKLDLTELYTTFQPNWHSGIAHAAMVMNVQVVAPDGAVTFDRTMSGTGGISSQNPGGDNTSAGLDEALSDAINKLASNDQFDRSIVYANRLRRPAGHQTADQAVAPDFATVSR